jgi:transportin-3
LLANHVEMLHKFYESVLEHLVPASQEEVTEGVACVVSVQPLDKIYPTMKLFCDPIIRRMMAKAQSAKAGDGETAQLAVAGKYLPYLIEIRLLTEAM